MHSGMGSGMLWTHGVRGTGAKLEWDVMGDKATLQLFFVNLHSIQNPHAPLHSHALAMLHEEINGYNTPTLYSTNKIDVNFIISLPACSRAQFCILIYILYSLNWLNQQRSCIYMYTCICISEELAAINRRRVKASLRVLSACSMS